MLGTATWYLFTESLVTQLLVQLMEMIDRQLF